MVRLFKENNELGKTECYELLAKCAYAACLCANDLKHIHLHVSGPRFDNVHEMTNDFYNKVSDELDWCCEVALEGNAEIVNLTNAYEQLSDWVIEDKKDYDYITGTTATQRILNAYTDILSDARDFDEMPSDIVSELDSLIREWNKQTKFIITRKLK